MRKLITAFAATLVLLCFALRRRSRKTGRTKPIRVIVPFPAGGGTDVVARMVADHLSKLLGQPIFVENRGSTNRRRGFGGAQAIRDPDGYTLGFTSDTPMTVRSVALQGSVLRSAEGLRAGGVRGAAAGNAGGDPALPANTIAELIALAKRKRPTGSASGPPVSAISAIWRWC